MPILALCHSQFLYVSAQTVAAIAESFVPVIYLFLLSPLPNFVVLDVVVVVTAFPLLPSPLQSFETVVTTAIVVSAPPAV